MRSFSTIFMLIFLCLLPCVAGAQKTPVIVSYARYDLLTNASSSGPFVVADGSNYLLSISGTFGGTSVAITATTAGGTTTLATYTSAPASPVCFAIAAGTTIQATVTGGSPSGLYATLGGVGPGGCGIVGATGVVITVSGSPVSVTNGLPVAPVTITWTQTIVTLAAAASAPLIGANAARKALRWMVTGTNPMTVAPGAVTVTAGSGFNYSPGSGTGFQGGADGFPGEVSTQAFSAISTLGTTVTVWEGQ